METCLGFGTKLRRTVAALSLAGLAAAGASAGDLTGRVVVATAVRRDEKPRGDAYGARNAPLPGDAAPAPRGEAQNVVVFIKGTVPGTFTPPATRPAMAQVDARFEPRVVPVLAGTTVEFPNRDSIYHNIFSLTQGANFNLGRYPRPESRAHTFEKPGLVRVNCDIHAHMLGFVLVLPHPYFAVPGADGSWRIPGIPAGSYHLVAWHDTLPPQVREVVVPAAGSLEASFQF